MPSSFLLSCNNRNFMSAPVSTSRTISTPALTSRRHKRRHRPVVEFIHRLQVPAPSQPRSYLPLAATYIAPSLRITSSTASKLAFAIICITCRSCPPPTRVGPLPVDCCVALDAPDSAVSVPANADVDHVGRFAASGEVTVCAGFSDWCVSEYRGVSEGESRNRWCDIVQCFERMSISVVSTRPIQSRFPSIEPNTSLCFSPPWPLPSFP